MSRRLVQTLQRSFRAARAPTVHVANLQRSPLIPRYAPFVVSARSYATENPRGVPVNKQHEHDLSPPEQEREEMHKQAQKEVEAGQFDKAIEIYNTLLSREDLTRLEKRLAFFNLGVIHHRKGDESKGIAYWHDTVSIPISTTDPLLEAEEIELAAAANMNLGAHYVLAKDIEKGMGYLQKAVDLDPEDGEIRFNLAATLAGMGRYDEAIQEFEAAEERGVEIAREVIDKIKAGMEEKAKGPEKE